MIDLKTAAMSLVLNIANIVVLFLIIRSLVYKPVKKFMAARRKAVEDELAQSEAKLKAAEDAKAEAERAVAAAAESAETEKRRILDEAEANAHRIIDEAEVNADAIRDGATAQAAHASDRMLDDMRERIADLAVDIAGGIVGRELEKSGNQEFIDQYFDRVAGK